MPNEELDQKLSKLTHEELLALPTIDRLFATVRSFSVTALPPEYQTAIDADMWTVRVEWRSEDKWAVITRSGQIGADGTEGYESLPSSRTDKYIANYRFDLATALALAEETAKKISIMGITVESFIKIEDARTLAKEQFPDEDMNSAVRRRAYYEALKGMNPDENLTARIERGLEELDSRS